VFEDGERVDKIVDISTPPIGYHDLGIDFSFGPYTMSSFKMNISLLFDNVLNNRYRNYQNRLRFYSDEVGRNIMLQIKIQH
jgi:iron complex outermembrane receptor protein